MPEATVTNQKDTVAAFPLLTFLTLFDVQIDIEPVDNIKDSGLTYDIFVTPPERNGEGQFTFRCEVAVGRKKKDQEQNFIEIAATYGLIVASDNDNDDENMEVARHYAATSAWASFASLFAVISHQMKVEFPPLPPYPGVVDVRVMEEDEEILEAEDMSE